MQNTDLQGDSTVILAHQPCDDCGSSDALAVYTSSTYCFSCGTHKFTDKDTPTPQKRTHTNMDLITESKYQALKKRGIDVNTCRKYGYTIGKYKDDTVQIANYYNKSKEVVAQKVRTKDKDFLLLGSIKDAGLFGQQLWKEGGKRIIIVEGEIDCMTVSQAYNHKFEVVSVPNGAQGAKKALMKHLEYLESFSVIVLAFDNDEPGRRAMDECATIFKPGKVKMCYWEGAKDANDLLVRGDLNSIVTSIANAKEYRPDGIIEGEDIWKAMTVKDTTVVYPTPYIELNYKLRGGMRKGRLYTFTAGSGIGKSTVVKEIGYHLKMTHGLNLGVVALEEGKEETAHSFAGIYLDKPLLEDPDCATMEQKREAFDKVMAHGFYLHDHFGSLESDNLLNKLRYLAIGCDVDFIILDHISIVISGDDGADDNERRAIDKLMTNLRSLVQETGVGMLLVSHLSNKRGGAKAHEDGGKISLSELRGSGGIKQLSDFVIGLERDQQGNKPNEANIRVLKARLGGRTGLAGTLEFNPMTGRLLPVDKHDNPKDTTNDDF